MEIEQTFLEPIYNCLTSYRYSQMDWTKLSPSRS